MKKVPIEIIIMPSKEVFCWMFVTPKQAKELLKKAKNKKVTGFYIRIHNQLI